MMLAWESLKVSSGSNDVGVAAGRALMLARHSFKVRSSNHVDNRPVVL